MTITQPTEGRRWLRTWLLSFMVLFVLSAIWSLATPLFTAPDEPAHVIRAAAAVRNQVTPPTLKGAMSLVAVPKAIAQAASKGESSSNCYFDLPRQPSACRLHLGAGSTHGSAWATTYVGHYPPLYYLLVGLPTLITYHPVVYYLMRLISAALSSAFLAAAICAAARSSRSTLAPLGVALAVSPMVLYLAGMVNPSGFEISCTVCVYCTGFTLLGDSDLNRSRFLIGWLAVSAGLLVQTKGLSPLFLAVAIVAFFALFGFAPWRRVLQTRLAKVGVVFVGVCSLFALAWLAIVNSLDIVAAAAGPSPDRGLRLVSDSFGHFASTVPEMIGVFGHLDTPLPTVGFDIWYGAVAIVFAIAVARFWTRGLDVLVGAALVGVAVPVIVGAIQAPRIGFVGQGRDWLPLEVSVPILAAFAAGRMVKANPRTTKLTSLIFKDATASWLLPALVVIAIVGVGTVQEMALVQLIHRYRNGLGNPVDLFGTANWNPPVPIAVLLAVSVVLTTISCVWVARTTLTNLAAQRGALQIRNLRSYAPGRME